MEDKSISILENFESSLYIISWIFLATLAIFSIVRIASRTDMTRMRKSFWFVTSLFPGFGAFYLIFLEKRQSLKLIGVLALILVILADWQIGGFYFPGEASADSRFAVCYDGAPEENKSGLKTCSEVGDIFNSAQ